MNPILSTVGKGGGRRQIGKYGSFLKEVEGDQHTCKRGREKKEEKRNRK